MNIRDLMARIDTLQAYDEPVVEEYTPIQTVNPLVAAMRELQEEGIVESVDPGTIFNQVKEIHREFRDFEEGDLPDRIYWFNEYKTSQIPLSKINLDEFYVDEDLVEEYIDFIKDSPNTMPPIVYDPIEGSVIDGMHRANAYARLGYDTIPAYVGLTKSSSYGERESEIEEGPDGDHQTGGALGLPFPGTYEQEFGNFKRHGQRRMGTLTTEALVSIVSEDAAETVTLFNLYDGAWPDDDEMIWNYVTDSDFDIPFEVNAMRPFILDQILCDQYGVDDVEDLFHKMQPDQEAIIKDYQDDPNLPQQVIVMHGNQILDGNHRALAAVLSNRPIKYIDIGEEEDAEV